MRFLVLSFASAALLAVAAPARAQDAPAHEAPPEAISLYQHGRELYRQGRYRDAVQELERALMLDPASPNLVYNVARVHELLGELPEAIRYYERYLALLGPDEHDEHDRTMSTIQRLQGAQHEVHTPPPPPAGSGGELRDIAPEVHVEHGVADEAFWATLVGSGVVLVAAIITGSLALARDSDVANFVSTGAATDVDDRNALISDVHTLALATDVLFGISAVAALSATFLYFLRDKVEIVPHDGGANGTAEARLVPFAGAVPGGAVLGLGGAL